MSGLGDIDGLLLVNKGGLSDLNLSGGVAELVDGEDVISGLGDGVVCDLRVDDVDELVVNSEGVNLSISGLNNNIKSGAVLNSSGGLGGVGGAVDNLVLDGWVGDEDVSDSVLNLVVVDGGGGGPVVVSWGLSLLDIGDGSVGSSIKSEWSGLGDVLVVGVEDWFFPCHGGGGEECDGESLDRKSVV